MASAPQWKVYDSTGNYQAACKEIEAAAALMGFYGNGASIRHGHDRSDVVWTEGEDERYASESYDRVAVVAQVRLARKLRYLAP